jgi:hypothetical protein
MVKRRVWPQSLFKLTLNKKMFEVGLLQFQTVWTLGVLSRVVRFEIRDRPIGRVLVTAGQQVRPERCLN